MPRPGVLAAPACSRPSTSGQPDEHVLRLLREAAALVDAEVVAGQLERELRGVRDGDASPGPCQAVRTPKNSHERRHLARRAEAADLRDVDADEVDQPVRDERHVLVLRC